MSRRFQFSLRDLLGVLVLVALIVWATTLVGVVRVGLAFFLISPTIGGALLRKPLEGCLANVFFLVVVYCVVVPLLAN